MLFCGWRNSLRRLLAIIEDKRTSGYLAHLIVCAAMLCLLGACVDTSGWVRNCDHNLPELATWKDLIYPGAQQIQKNGSAERMETSFTTSDAPETVLAYYKDVLLKAHWQLDFPKTQIPNELRFRVANCCYFGSVSVIAESTGPGRTNVVVKSWWDMGCG